MKILNLIREQKKFTYPTLDGRKISNPLIYWLLDKELEIEMENIGRENKSKLRKEARGNPFLQTKLKKGESV